MEYKKVRMTEAQQASAFVCDMNTDFLMGVEEVITVPGLGTVVTGFAEEGSVSSGSSVSAIARDGRCTTLKVREVIHYQQKERLTHEHGKTVSLRFDELPEGTVREGDIIIRLTSCPAGFGNLDDGQEWN